MHPLTTKLLKDEVTKIASRINNLINSHPNTPKEELINIYQLTIDVESHLEQLDSAPMTSNYSDWRDAPRGDDSEGTYDSAHEVS